MSSASNGTKRVRTRKACGACSIRKRKCDGKQPCSTCEGYGYVCSYSINSSLQSEVSDNHSCASGTTIQEALEPDNAYIPVESIPRPAPATGNTSHSSLVAAPACRDPRPLTFPAVRYIEEHSLEAFPRYLGLQLHSDLSRLESFGWNLGIRDLAVPQVETPLICSMVGLSAVRNYLQRFFEIQFPACGFLDFDAITNKCGQHWNGSHQGLQFEALIATIIGLSCIVAPTDTESLLQAEVDLMRYAESILNDSQVLAHSTLEGVSAMFLRCLYLRSTSTPRITWLTSCNNMHMAENLGLHKDYSDLAASGVLPRGDGWTAQARACLFWMICTTNRIMSYELGHTPVRIRGVTQKFPFDASDNSNPACLCRLGQLLPLDDEACCNSDEFRLAEVLNTIGGASSDQPYIKLLAADVCFSLFRRIWVSNSNEGGGINHQNRKQIASIGREAVRATNLILQKGQTWWNMLSTLFHFACILIALEADTLADLQDTMRTIYLLRDRFPKSRAADAIRTINRLAIALKQRKETHLQYLSVAVGPPSMSFEEMASFPSADVPAQSNWDWSLGVLDWDEFGIDWMNADAAAPTSSMITGDLLTFSNFS